MQGYLCYPRSCIIKEILRGPLANEVLALGRTNKSRYEKPFMKKI